MENLKHHFISHRFAARAGWTGAVSQFRSTVAWILVAQPFRHWPVADQTNGYCYCWFRLQSEEVAANQEGMVPWRRREMLVTMQPSVATAANWCSAASAWRNGPQPNQSAGSVPLGSGSGGQPPWVLVPVFQWCLKSKFETENFLGFTPKIIIPLLLKTKFCWLNWSSGMVGSLIPSCWFVGCATSSLGTTWPRKSCCDVSWWDVTGETSKSPGGFCTACRWFMTAIRLLKYVYVSNGEYIN